MIFSVPLDYAYAAIILKLIFVNIYAHFKIKSDPFNWKHPLFLIALPCILIFMMSFYKPYRITSWDEYSHWLTMPKQYLLHKTLVTTDFLIKNFISYTPAWSLYTILGSLLNQSDLMVDFILLQNLMFGFITFSALYDILKKIFSDRPEADFCIFLVFLSLCHFQIGLLYPMTNLVEFPMHLIFTVIITFSIYLLNGTRNRFEIFLFGFLCSQAYLLRHSFLTILFYIVLLMSMYGYFQKLRLSNVVKLVVFSALPFMFFYASWNFKLKMYSVTTTLSPMNLSNFDQFKSLWNERSGLFLHSANRLGLFFSEDGFFQYLCAIFILSFFSKNLFRTSIVAMIFSFIYLAALLWMYLTSFGGFEALHLMSFERYILAPLYGYITIGAVFLAVTISSLLKLAKPTARLIISHRSSYFFAIVLVAYVHHNMNEVYPNLKTTVQAASTQVDSVKQLIDRLGLDSPHVRILEQGGTEYVYHQANFASIGLRKYYYRTRQGTTFGPVKDNIWRQKYEVEDFLKLIVNDEIIWVVKSDQWLDSTLALVTRKGCQLTPENSFLVKAKDGFYDCFPK